MLICKVSPSPSSIHYSLYATSPFLLTRPRLDCYILIGFRNRGLFYFFFCVGKHPFYGAILKLKVKSEKDSEIAATPLCLGNISKDWPVDNMKKTGFNGYVYDDFSVGYDDIEADNIKDIHKYLMKKNNVV